MHDSSPKVAFVLDSVLLFGRELAIIDLAATLQGRGFDITFLVPKTYSGARVVPKLRKLGLNFRELNFHDQLRSSDNWQTRIKAAWNILRSSMQLAIVQRREQFDLVLMGTIHEVINFMPFLAISGLPVVYRLGDVEDFGKHHKVKQLAWRWLAGRASTVVCISRFVCTQLTDRFPDARTKIIINRPVSVDHDGFKRSRRPESELVIGYIGRLSEAKGLRLLVEACEQLQSRDMHFKLRLAGSALPQDKDFESWLLAKVESHDWIQLIGHQDQPMKFYAGIDLHVSPSYLEALGNTIIEAKSAGVPSVVTPVGGQTELISSGHNGEIATGMMPKDLADALAGYIVSPGLCIEHGEAARSSLDQLGIMEFADKWAAVMVQAGRA